MMRLPSFRDIVKIGGSDTWPDADAEPRVLARAADVLRWSSVRLEGDESWFTGLGSAVLVNGPWQTVRSLSHRSCVEWERSGGSQLSGSRRQPEHRLGRAVTQTSIQSLRANGDAMREQEDK